ncbi:hypothetical protein GW750_04125 [bacterium]|nr:hypothetical protein [bacterium]
MLAQCTHNATVYKSFLQEHNPQTDFVLQEKKAVTAASVNLAAAQQKLDTHFKN